jgi:ribosome-binding protein aMBF1 (putative translation factor)
MPVMARYRTEDLTDSDLREAQSALRECFPRRLRELREAQGMSLAEVGRDVNMSKQVLDLYETGRAIPSLARAVSLAAYYGVTLDELVWEEQK